MSGETAHLLLVEDSDTQALQIRRVLEGHGFSVDRAASAEAALERLNGTLPDLVVSDYHLPGMNGGELARELRLNMRTRAIPVLMLTEASGPGLEREGLESGADAYVPKSAGQELIVLRIRALLRQRGDRPSDTESLPDAPQSGFAKGVGMFRRARILLVRGLRPDGDDACPGDGDGDGLAALLARDGHVMERVSGPEAARAALERPLASGETNPDCIVVDLRAIGFDGVGFCAWLDAARRRASRPETLRQEGPRPEGPTQEPRQERRQEPRQEQRQEPRHEPGQGRRGSYRILGLGDGDTLGSTGLTARAYEAGVDDVVSETAGVEAVGLRIRAVVRRKLLQDETARIDADLRERQAAIERAREEASANVAKASLAEALARANTALGRANDSLREAQGKLVQAAKMASLGELVAGIAHEINNPLAFILAHQGTVERLLDQLGAMPELDAEPMAPKLARARARVGSMSLGLKRIQNLVLNLRKFSRLDESEQQGVDVPDAIDTVLALLTHKLGTGITVTRHYEAPRELMCQPALLNQVIMNIVGNAADALNAGAPDAGAPDAGAPPPEQRNATGGRIAIRTSAAGGFYAIAVEDNGPGVPDALRERVFEPFFTTKPVGAGTGLGLAIAYSVVQAHGGSISLDGAPGGGACFTVSVPYEPARTLAAMP